jgi:UDP-N-acetylmuramoylalanine--D-glutamate ligase
MNSVFPSNNSKTSDPSHASHASHNSDTPTPSTASTQLSELKKILGCKVALVGMGRSGQSALRLLKILQDKNFLQLSCIMTYDDTNSAYSPLTTEELTQHGFDSLIVAPGVPLKKVRSLIPSSYNPVILNEVDLASFFLTDEIVIGITGSVGKSTTTSLLGESLKTLDPHCFVGGNLGTPFCEYALTLIQQQIKAQFIVLELSSYHLENLQYIRFHSSAITSLLPNHLERYPSKIDYFHTKLSLFLRTNNLVVLNRNGGELFSFLESNPPQQPCSIPSMDPVHPVPPILSTHSMPSIHSMHSRTSALSMPSEKVSFLWTDVTAHPDFDFSQLELLGQYNFDNVSVALSLLKAVMKEKNLVVTVLQIRSFFQFKGLPHRLESMGVFLGIHFVNDSKATTIQSVLESVKTLTLKNKTIHLLLGGRDKNLDWTPLAILKSNPSVQCYFFGESCEMIPEKTNLNGLKFKTLKDCLKEVQNKILQGDIKCEDLVLLSPGGTSLDEFSSFEQRGDFFKSWVQSLQRETL